MSSFEYAVAPRTVDVLPAQAGRRLTRRDAVLPLVLVLELLVGVAFGLAGSSGSSEVTSVPAKITVGTSPLVTVSPTLSPAAVVLGPHPPRDPFRSLVTTPVP